MNFYEKCPVCDGSGYLHNEYEKVRCWSYEVARRLGKPEPEISPKPREKCPVCNGEGVIVSEEGAAFLNFVKRHIADILPANK